MRSIKHADIMRHPRILYIVCYKTTRAHNFLRLQLTNFETENKRPKIYTSLSIMGKKIQSRMWELKEGKKGVKV